MDGADARSMYRSSSIMGAAHGLNHAYLLFFTPLLKTIQEALGVDWVQLGALVSFAFIAFGLGALPAGIVSDYIGRKKTVIIASLFPAVGGVIGFLAGSYWMMAASFIVLGIGASIYHPAAYALVTGLTDARHRGKALGIHGVGGNIGMALAPVLTAGVVHVGNWRYAFLLWALIGVAVALVVQWGIPEVESEETSEEDKSAPRISIWQLLTATVIAALGILALQGFFNDGVFAYLPTFLQETKSLSIVLSGLVAGVNFGAGILGQMVGGVLSDMYGRKPAILWGSIGCVVTFAGLPLLNNDYALLAGVFVMGFSIFMLQPPINALVADVTPSNVRGTLFGVVFLAKYGIGALAPFVGGVIAATAAGLNGFFYLLAGTAALSIALLVFIPHRRPSEFTDEAGSTASS